MQNAIIGGLVVAVAVLGFLFYEERQKPTTGEWLEENVVEFRKDEATQSDPEAALKAAIEAELQNNPVVLQKSN